MRTVTESIWSIWVQTLAIVVSLALVVVGPLGVASAWAQDGEVESSQDAADDPGDVMDTPDDLEAADDEPVEEEEDEVEITEDDEADDETSAAEDKAAGRMGDALGVSILGVASIVGGIVFMVQSGDSSDRADEAGLVGDDIGASDLRDRSDRERALGITLTSLGIVLAGVATWLWIDYVQLRDEADAQSAGEEDDVVWHVMPSVDPQGGGGFVIGGRF